MTEREELAAEYVLGLLEGQDLLTARGLAVRDSAFAALVADWEAKFAPLFDAIAPIEPGSHVWASIEQAIGELRAPDVIRLQRQMRRWQIGAGIAASLALVLATFAVLPNRTPAPVTIPQVQPAPALAAAFAPAGGGSFSVVYHPEKHELVALAPDMPGKKGRDLELWVLPAGAPPQSLGVLAPGGTRRMPMPPALAARLTAGATLAVSLEPVGGSPTGLPTGPVLGTAKISAT
jgi:anti-sigma-K factor RskA